MKVMRFIALICVALSASVFAAATEVPANKENFELFLLVGQSNMAGRGALQPADRNPVRGILILDKNDQWEHKGEPVHFDRPRIAGVGLGFTFAKLVAQGNRDITVGLIPCAIGDTGIATWRPGGVNFEEAIRRAKIAQQSGTIKAILWHQGESHIGRQNVAENYAQHLKVVMEGFRRELNLPDVPIIVGELGDFLGERVGKSGQRAPYVEVMNEQIRLFAETFPISAAVSAKGLGHNGDLLHFNADGLKIFGERYFSAYQDLIRKKQ